MNREIKFRVWDNVDYMSSTFNLSDIIERKIGFTGDCVVMQYTGLKDKNGYEIYEGDLIHYEDDFFRVSFEHGRFIATNYNGLYISSEDFYHSKMIGNIYENSELIKQ